MLEYYLDVTTGEAQDFLEACRKNNAQLRMVPVGYPSPGLCTLGIQFRSNRWLNWAQEFIGERRKLREQLDQSIRRTF